MHKADNDMPEKMMLPTAYLPSVYYVSKIIAQETIYLDVYETYLKQSLRNRAYIMGANGVMALSIPVKKRIKMHQQTKDICIDYSTPWQKNHWRSITSAYNASPFFLYYKDVLQNFYEERFDFLVDYNAALLKALLDFSFDKKFNIKLIKNETDHKTYNSDFRYICSAKGKSEPGVLSKHVSFNEYFQVFSHKHGFKPNLSIIDLLFNMGPKNAFNYLRFEVR